MLLIRKLIRVFQILKLALVQLLMQLLDTIVCLQGCNSDVIPVSEVHKLCPKIRYIADVASEWVGNRVGISAYLFIYAFRKHLVA